MELQFLLDPVVNHAFYLEMLVRAGMDAGPVKTDRLRLGIDVGKLVLTPEEQGEAIVSAGTIKGYTDSVAALVTERLVIWRRCLLDSSSWYLESVWPDHLSRLTEAFGRLEPYFLPGRPGEAGLAAMADMLDTPWQPQTAVHLVAERHSAMSQGVPPIICIYTHSTERLIDILFHELLHILVDRPAPDGVCGRLRAALLERGLPLNATRDIEHSLVFLFGAEMARRYVPATRRVKPYHRILPAVQSRYAAYFRIYSAYQFPRRRDRLETVSPVADELVRAWRQTR